MEPARRDLAAIAFALAFPSIATWIYFVLLADRPPGSQTAAAVAGKVVQFGFPVLWTFAVLRERPPSLRPVGRGVVAGLCFGALVGATMFALALLWLEPRGYLVEPSAMMRTKLSGLGFGSLGEYVALGVFYSLCHSWLEEYYWRWFVFRRVRQHASLPAALVVSSLGFTAHHVILLATFFGWGSPATYLFSACVAVGGAAWAWLYERSGSLWGPWLSHMVVDAAIFVLGYVLVGDLLA